MAKTGLKLPPPKDEVCVSFPPGTTPHHVPGKVDCGYVALLQESGGLHLAGSKVRMADLVRELALVSDRAISDKTQFTGEFDLKLTFSVEGALPGLPGLRGLSGAAGSNLPNIFAALEEQLGLSLVPAKGPVEVLVVDDAEKPAEN